ncbi:hypothetical protein AZE42_14034 [Rhizopogon vesiculosus]|uniref:Uncharacterized protein n=1 Tax=Rhizopogon vesiculosus TaxID=180088 RepID=A0A1J8QB12_9AGAM|nr:hypothetical protein AZE42_14034 [Rhizopogon vesiculosus]
MVILSLHSSSTYQYNFAFFVTSESLEQIFSV